MTDRIATLVDALPLRPGLRVLEIGCGPGVAARLVHDRVAGGFVLAIDRSARAIALARRGSAEQLARGGLRFERAAIETFLPRARALRDFDLAFAFRVGALDGRHPELQQAALQNLAALIRPGGRLFIDGGSPLREVKLPRKPATAAQRLRRPAGASCTRGSPGAS